MSPKPVAIPSALEKAITDAFGSVDKFKEDFSAAGAGQFGSGWAWLVKDTDGALKVTKTENGVNPLCFGQTALLGCRRVGALLLHRLPQQAAGLPHQLPRQAGELGQRRLAALTLLRGAAARRPSIFSGPVRLQLPHK